MPSKGVISVSRHRRRRRRRLRRRLHRRLHRRRPRQQPLMRNRRGMIYDVT